MHDACSHEELKYPTAEKKLVEKNSVKYLLVLQKKNEVEQGSARCVNECKYVQTTEKKKKTVYLKNY